MMKRKLYSFLLPTLLICLLAVCGTTMAYMYTRSDTKENQFSVAEVGCRIEEAVSGDGAAKTSIKVQNTGNIDAYVRVQMVSYWVQDDGAGNVHIVGEPSVMPEITPRSGWLKGSNNIFYYTRPVKAGVSDCWTEELLSEALALEVHEDGYLQVIEVFAEAIQSKPVTAVTDSWGVHVEGDVITSVP